MVLIFVFLLSISFISAYPPNDDISIIRQRVLEQRIWPPRSSIPATVQSALMYQQTLNSSCYWPDINYMDQGRAVWLTVTHLVRVTTMLQALTVNGSTERNNTALLSAAHCAFDVWLVRDWQNPNWYWNRISIPLRTVNHLLMLGDNVTSFELEKIKEISYRANWWNGDPSTTGANLAWMIQVQIYRSLATRNITGIEQGFTKMWQDIMIQPSDKEGIQNDYAYHFHGAQLLSASYGEVWAMNIFAFFMCSVETQYAPSLDKLVIFAEFLTKGDAWMIIKNQWDWHVLGRAIARPDTEYIGEYNTHAMRTSQDVHSDRRKDRLKRPETVN